MAETKVKRWKVEEVLTALGALAQRVEGCRMTLTGQTEVSSRRVTSGVLELLLDPLSM